jgi:hypothetical protein
MKLGSSIPLAPQPCNLHDPEPVQSTSRHHTLPAYNAPYPFKHKVKVLFCQRLHEFTTSVQQHWLLLPMSVINVNMHRLQKHQRKTISIDEKLHVIRLEKRQRTVDMCRNVSERTVDMCRNVSERTVDMCRNVSERTVDMCRDVSLAHSSVHTIRVMPTELKKVLSAFFMTRQPLGGLGRVIIEASLSHSDTPHSVGLLWTSDRPVAETST